MPDPQCPHVDIRKYSCGHYYLQDNVYTHSPLKGGACVYTLWTLVYLSVNMSEKPHV